MATAVRIEPDVTEVPSGGRSLEVATVALGGVPRGAVVLLSGAGGLRHVEVVDAMNELAEHGYESVAADLGPAEDDDAALEHLRTLLDRLAARGWDLDQIGVVGYGSGGRVALLAAAAMELGAAVSVRPVLPAGLDARPVDPVRTAWLGLFGALDERTPPGSLAAFGAALAASSPVFTQVVSYPGVTGEFVHDGLHPLTHAAAYDSWQRTVEWLNARVVPRPTPLARAWHERLAHRERLSA
ncbi:dienelactone hydrolase family protein [Geodermatophilus sabuli]|uniref:Dienelactone hydrolase n=1 Tax=Geodermatophilus sabuli TaxID=1564158 RepID=A0A285E981_9ACTN|nr:dienelactone hydrolase family protein [Geodermatophilus sabuli]MBB3082376.1 carboxymethylenebutenolidase [Geodermatophilus sabuli]SNX94754.1 Dienelactone hydrolase [Geodermatophilus sabuli]